MHLRNALPAAALLSLGVVVPALLLSSCGGGGKRDVSTPEKALRGHWVTTERGTRVNYYFGAGTLILAASGKSMELRYDVVYSDDQANKIVINITMDVAEMPMPFSMGMEKELVFSKNRKSLTELSEVNGVKFTNKWKYVDSKTTP